MSRLKYLENLDLKQVPNDVLKAIARAVDAELTARSEVYGTDKSNMWQFKTRSKVLRLPTAERTFDALDAEPWEYLFPNCDPTPKYYVYAHMTNGGRVAQHFGCKLPFGLERLPFYIGKGTGDRAYNLGRNQGHRAFLQERKRLDREAPLVLILRDGLTEAQAFALESKLIYFFGTRYEIGRNGVLVNLDVPKRAEWCMKAESPKAALDSNFANAIIEA